jgi:hypothetical protein
MKLVTTFVFLASFNCLAQNVTVKSDTILKKEYSTLSIDNGFAIPPFEVSGIFSLTNEHLGFHPQPFRKNRYEMHNDLIKDIILPYDCIVRASRRGLFGLKVKTKTKLYKFNIKNTSLRTTIALINRQMKEHGSK